VLTGLHPDVAQIVREAVRPLVELSERQTAIARDEGRSIGHVVGNELVQVREVEFHGAHHTS